MLYHTSLSASMSNVKTISLSAILALGTCALLMFLWMVISRPSAGLPIFAYATPASSSIFFARGALASLTCITTPGFSAKSIFTISASCILSKQRSRPPFVFAKHISRSVVMIPPAEMSCPASTSPSFTSCCIVMNASRKYSAFFTVGTSEPTFPCDCANAEPPSCSLSNEKSM